MVSDKSGAIQLPAFRQISATGAPCSPSFKMKAFCASVNFDAFMRFRSSPSQERLAENSSFKRSSFHGAEHDLTNPLNGGRADKEVLSCPSVG